MPSETEFNKSVLEIIQQEQPTVKYKRAKQKI